MVLGHTWVRGTRQLNDFRFQYARAAYYISPAGTEIWTDISNNSPERLARLTRQLQFPALTYGSSNDQIGPESRWQFKDTYAITLTSHDLKFGVDISHMPYKYESTGNPLGTYTFSRDQYFDPNDPASIAALTGAATFTASVPPVTTSHPNSYYVGVRAGRLAAARQRDRQPRPALRAALRRGQRGPRSVRVPGRRFPTSTSSGRGDTNNFGPRAGVAWDVGGTGRTVVRGGYGLYYGHVRILGNLSEFRNYQQFSVNITNPSYPDPYGGRDPLSFIVSVAGQHHGGRQRLRAARTRISSTCGVSQQLFGEYGLHLDAVITNTDHDRKILDINARVSRRGDAVRTRPSRASIAISRPAAPATARSMPSSTSASAAATSSW